MSTDLIAGDLNGDERVDSFDVVLCRQEIVNVQNDSEVNVLEDIDKNGKVQVNDLVLIANFVLGKKIISHKTDKPVHMDWLSCCI